ncbi:type II toxin-antitoxin system RelE/ParE family toxin [Tundrisphaera sp. TA3]|uniref:type II toxin-antitoxin system RelE/ParE family toxin n=1 Tax=Tundrisphaera sp. TA3 TaxID=3435775 RepID=UPI003EBF2171
MKLPLRVLPAAQRDLDDIAEYIARANGPKPSLRLLDAVPETFRSIAAMPGLGERLDLKSPAFATVRTRSIDGFKNLIVYYKIDRSEIIVLRILHGARDVEQSLGSDLL